MSSYADKVFDQVADKLRKKKGQCPPTPVEAAEAFKKTKAITLSEQEKTDIINAMLAGNAQERTVVPSKPILTEPVDKNVVVQGQALFRNSGESDEETDNREAALDRQLLEDEDDEQDRSV